MPATSRKQFRFMKAVEHGGVKKKDLSEEQAKEYTESNKGKKAYKKLPEEKKEKKSKKKDKK